MDSLGRTHIGLHELLAIHGQMNELLAPGERAAPATLLAGLRQARLHGRSLEFDQVRTYQPGDDARHIDWRASARAGGIQTRLFQRERDRPVFIAVEQGPDMFFASTGNFKSVQAALAASLFAWAADSVHDRVGGLVFGRETVRLTLPARNRQGILHLLHNVSQENLQLDSPFPADGIPPLQQALEHCRIQLQPGAVLVLICSESHLDSDSAKQLGTLASRHQSIWLPVSDPLEHQLPEQPGLAFSGQQQRLQLSRQQLRLRHQWQQQARATRQRWQQLAGQHGAILLPVCTSSSLADQLPVLQEGLHAACA